MANTITRNNYFFGPAFGRVLKRANIYANTVLDSCSYNLGLSDNKANPERPASKMLGLAGMVVAGLGIISSFLGFAKNNSFVKVGGMFLGAIGVGVALVSKFLENELDILGSLQKKVVVGGATGVSTKPEDVGLSNTEVVNIKTEDNEELKGHFIKAPVPTQKTIIYIHGVRSNVGRCLDEIKKIQEKVPANVLVVDPRGFGDSTLNNKIISTQGLITDGKAMYDYLIKEKGLKAEDISIFGHSLGGAIAVGVAKERKVNSLILQSTFTKTSQCAEEALKKLLPEVIASRMGKLLSTDFNSAEDIKYVKADNLVIFHGENDLITPSSEGKELYEISAQNKNLKSRNWILQPKADHTNYYDFYTSENFDLINKIINQAEVSTESEGSATPLQIVVNNGTPSKELQEVA